MLYWENPNRSHEHYLLMFVEFCAAKSLPLLSPCSDTHFPPTSLMLAHLNIDQLLKKLTCPTKKVGPKHVKKLWRYQKSNHTGIKLTNAKRQECKEWHERKHNELKDALMTTHKTMYKYMEAMSTQFRCVHGLDYYYYHIMQCSSLSQFSMPHLVSLT